MARLHKEFFEFDKTIKLSQKRLEELEGSINEIERKLIRYFENEKPNEIQPIFKKQGSFVMDTIIHPIKTDKGLEYDLDDGVYFVGNEHLNYYEVSIQQLHNWVYNATDNHTTKPNQDKTTCVRVLFQSGRHIDLPIYYQYANNIYLAHKTKGWIESNPVAFSNWFNNKATDQLKRIVRALKAWKNFRENKNTNLKFPSGFALTILATNSYYKSDFDDEAFLKTIQSIYENLDNNFECLRPTTPKNEDIFEDFSDTREDNFMSALKSLVKDAEKAYDEPNYKIASEYLQNQFGDRFPTGKNKDSKDRVKKLSSVFAAATIKPKPYASFFETLLVLVAVVGLLHLLDE